MPACFIPAISAIASPLLSTEAAPMGHTRTLAPAFARSRMKRVTEALSFTGFVFGMQQTAVNPPRAAARVPVSIVSEDSWPGSRRCACRSIKPGATTSPLASKTSAFCGATIFPAGATSFIFSSSTRTSSDASVFDAGSSTRPFLIRSIGGFLGFHFERRMRIGFCSAADEEIKNGHANGDAVGDLLQDAGLRSIGDLRRDFNAAVDRPGMKDDGVAAGAPQPLRVELVEKNVIVGGKRGLVQAFGLDAQHEDDVRAFQRLLDPVDAANRRPGCDFFKFARYPHGRAAKRKSAAEFSEQMNVRTGHAAVQDVAEDGHVEILYRAQPVPDCQRIQQPL